MRSVQYSTVQCEVVHCSGYSAVQCEVVQCSGYSVGQEGAVRCNVGQYGAVRYNMVSPWGGRGAVIARVRGRAWGAGRTCDLYAWLLCLTGMPACA